MFFFFYFFSGNTTNFSQHLAKSHPETSLNESKKSEVSSQKQKKLTDFAMVSNIPLSKSRQEEITAAVMNLIVEDLLGDSA